MSRRWLHVVITSCLLGYKYFNKYYKLIDTDFSKQQALDADPKALQQISFKEI